MRKIKLIAVVGPTAVGKTALGIELAKTFNGEIISGDSQQVYQKLDIGTAKASKEEQEQAYHHLIDVREVNENYSVYDFVKEAKVAIDTIISKGKIPIIVGGTGLYLQSLFEGYHLGGEVNQETLMAYREKLESLSDEDLFEKLTEQSIIIPQVNRRRAIRALELAKFGNNLQNSESPYDVLLIGLNDDRQVLYDRINRRVDLMMDNGLLDEAKWLYDNYSSVQASKGIGYKELFPYFSKQIPLEEAVDKLKQNTRRFAKRQLTWFRNRMNVEFIMVGEENYQQKIKRKVSDFLSSK
ncbi:TPA: tRNA (adenosine(37)-N6)-dimethylallyltransferase MiaA [Streptococcus agalactiae]|nr:tRNA (adenosine(37)-N6)-dimethylallyltransferase MiaA [Streptococcus agalactiae]HEN4292919.1 tRNA (adenosine(37)-N6)-dimethylallyltransferase MiaA [Streptococcus agalactiae]HEN4298721.1 tRNA (adenosine(37)-N6)-dimethylallyltransferase MiaA [Streptococcus agalactiae]HEN4300303.1 tRNA (adenosine(37)-N6)-dimethylallyltransferase MiaA [Streptococcus agalactiae]HEN4306425.1 tRNA (adenosine(37)-N6)-dimethylallyltransferase MiaA [Streptococcus agalactiae]